VPDRSPRQVPARPAAEAPVPPASHLRAGEPQGAGEPHSPDAVARDTRAGGVGGAGPAGRTGWLPVAGAAGGFCLLAASIVAALAVGQPNDARWLLLGLLGAAWLAFALAVRLLLRLPARHALPLLLAGGIALQVVAISVPPRSTDDFFRYAWDGRVQAAGIDPYRYPPTDPALSRLRDDWLFPPGCQAPDRACTVINHPDSPTIYPPVAQAWFLVVHAVSPAGSRHKPWQLAAALLAVLTTVALVRVLGAAGGDPRWAVLWAWCPAVPIEAGNAAHVDVLAVLLAVLALGVFARGRALTRAALGGVLTGAAIGVKLYPALLLPAVLRRPRGLAAVAIAGAAVAVAYLPHVAAVGGRVLGYLPGYLAEEGYDGSGRFPLLRLVMPHQLAPLAAAAILAAVAVLVARRSDSAAPWAGAVVLTGTAILVTAPTYPWYALLLVALVALSGRWEWLPAAVAAYPPYFAGALDLPHEPTKLASYGAAALAVIALTAARSVARREPPRFPPILRLRRSTRRGGPAQPRDRRKSILRTECFLRKCHDWPTGLSAAGQGRWIGPCRGRRWRSGPLPPPR
jgi:Glycosyltransferase family 87